MKPKDWYPAERTGIVWCARLFSNIVSPPVMGAVLGLVVSLHAFSFWPGLGWAALYSFFVSLTPIIFVLFLLKTGRIQELHMTDTRERHLPYIVGILSSLAAFGLVRALNGPSGLSCLAMLNAGQLAALGIINIYWLISFHTTAMTMTGFILWQVFGVWTLWLTVPLLCLVMGVRLFLKRHSVAQLIAGILLGSAIFYFISQLGCF